MDGAGKAVPGGIPAPLPSLLREGGDVNRDDGDRSFGRSLRTSPLSASTPSIEAARLWERRSPLDR
jgi:hypothetical protein